MTEPIITGRDELGFPKLFADIEVPAFTPRLSAVAMHASWDATTFFVASARDLVGGVVRVVAAATGSGEFAFHPVSWRQAPTQQPVINGLAAIHSTGPALVQVTCVEGDLSSVGNVRLPGSQQ